MKVAVICIVALLGLVASVCGEDIYDGIVNKRIDRTIDLSTQFARTKLSIEFTNSGSKPTSVYHFALLHSEHVALVEATDATGASLKVHNVGVQTRDKTRYVLYRVDFNKALESKVNQKVTIVIVQTHAQTPFPASILQNERQYVRYADDHYVFSPYATSEQTTTVKLPSSNIESKSELKPTSVKGDTITYGPYSDVAPFSSSPLSLHYENNQAFLTVTDMTKTIEISHWGNIAVETDYNVEHQGAKLKGQFSRYDYQRNPGGAASHIPVIRQILPYGAADVYYRDDIGNISTSHLHDVTLDMTPRFPLFGGWKIAFQNGYNLPSQYYLSTSTADSSLYVLNVTFSEAIEQATVDHLVIKVILPEGAKDAQVFTPFDVDSQKSDLHFTYLDTAGRPVILIEKRNVVPEQNRFFQVTYRFSSSSLFHEPLLLIGAFFTVFALIMAYARFDFSVGTAKRKSLYSEKVADALIKFKEVSEAREDLVASLEIALNRLLKDRNYNSYNAERKSVENSLAALKKEVTSALIEVEAANAAEIAKKMRDVEKKNEIRFANLFKIHELETEFKLEKKGNKSTVESSKNNLEKSNAILEEEMDNLVNDSIASL